MKKNQKRNCDRKNIVSTFEEKMKKVSKAGMNSKRNKILLVVLLLVLLLVIGWANKLVRQKAVKETMIQKNTDITIQASPEITATQEPVQIQPTRNPEDNVYSYLQGPRSWGQKITWSGYWGTTFMDGGAFGGFGCGLCCIANIYSSITPYRCTPVQAYEYAKKHTGYAGGSAIDWGYMRRTLSKMGMDCNVSRKPATYREFQGQIMNHTCMIALVSSSNSNCFLKDTPGHYVTLFLYDKNTDSVFIADSGEPKRNRKRIALKKVYRSLKTSSPWQTLLVKNYNENQDHWKHKKATGNWIHKE